MDFANSLNDQIEAVAQAKLEALLESRGVGKEHLEEVLKLQTEDAKDRRVDAIIRNNGYERAGDADKFLTTEERNRARITYPELVDALGTTEATIFIPRVMTRIVREAVEPVLVLANLFRRLRVPGATSVVQFPSVGAIQAFNIAEGEEYPDQKLEAAGYTIAKIGKVGLKVRFTEEVLRYSSFDLVGLHVRAAGRALARLKEQKAADQLASQGILSFDNVTPGAALNGKTTGRDLDLIGNDTITIHDIFQMYADLVNAGFMPTDFIVNPIGWLIFAREPTMRAWAFQNGGALFQPTQGQPGRGEPSESPNLGPGSGGGTTFGTINQQTTFQRHATSVFPANIGMIVSPFIPFDTALSTTTIHLVDRDEVGVIVQDEDVVMARFEDPHRDLQIMKWRERYGLAISNDGEGMVTANSVSIDKGFDFESSARLAISPTGTPTLPPIS